MANTTHTQQPGQNKGSKKKTPFDQKAYEKNTNQFKGSTLDQDTYGDTGMATKATGSGASGGYGSTGGSAESGSNEYRSPSDMSSSSGSFSGAPSGTSADTSGAYGNTNVGAKAGVGDNSAQPVSGRSVHSGADSGNVSGPSFGANTFGTGSEIGEDADISGVRSSSSIPESNVMDNKNFGEIDRDDSDSDLESEGDTTMKNTSDSSKSSDIQGLILRQIAEIGDLIERAGEKIEKAGFSRIGDAIFRLGDKLEHLKGSERHVRESKSSGQKADDSVEVDGSMPGMRRSGDTKSNQASGSEQSQAY